MANLALVTAGRVRVVESIEQMTLPFAESVNVGQAVRIDTTNGKWTKANGSSTTENRIWGVLVSKDGSGVAGTAIRRGVIDGFDLSGMDYDEPIYLSDTDGTFADAAGTVSTVVGRVIPAAATTLGTALDKLFHVHL